MDEFKSFAVIVLQSKSYVRIISRKSSTKEDVIPSKLYLKKMDTKESQLNYLCSVLPLKIFESISDWKFIPQFEDAYPYKESVNLKSKLFILYTEDDLDNYLDEFGYKLSFIPNIIRSSNESMVKKFFMRCMQAISSGYENPLDVETNLITDAEKQDLLKD